MENFPKLRNLEDNSIIDVNNTTFSIGRSLSCNHIIESLGVSRLHCILKKTEDTWCLFDRSTNGTAVNSKIYKFNENITLKEGDIIKLGESTQLEFTLNQAVEEVIPEELLEEFAHPMEAPRTVPPEPPKNEYVENELTCSICSELFIKAVTLNCSHSFCQFCIEQWRRAKASCPICRKHITSSAPTLVLDNLIDKFLESQSQEAVKLRREIVEQRKATPIEVVDLDSDDDDDENDYEYDDYSDYVYDDCDDDDYVEEEGVGGAYYGGYGRCYICDARGHWANGCPMRH